MKNSWKCPTLNSSRSFFQASVPFEELLCHPSGTPTITSFLFFAARFPFQRVSHLGSPGLHLLSTHWGWAVSTVNPYQRHGWGAGRPSARCISQAHIGEEQLSGMLLNPVCKHQPKPSLNGRLGQLFCILDATRTIKRVAMGMFSVWTPQHIQAAGTQLLKPLESIKKPCGNSLRTTCLSLFWFVNHPKTYISLCSFPDVPTLALLGSLLWLSHALSQHGSGDTEKLCFASLCPHPMPDPGVAPQALHTCWSHLLPALWVVPLSPREPHPVKGLCSSLSPGKAQA